MIEFTMTVDGVKVPFFVRLPTEPASEEVARARARDGAQAVQLKLLELQFAASGIAFDEQAETQRLFG